MLAAHIAMLYCLPKMRVRDGSRIGVLAAFECRISDTMPTRLILLDNA